MEKKKKRRAVAVEHSTRIEIKSELAIGRFSVLVTGLDVGDRHTRTVNAIAASISAVLDWAKRSSDALKAKTPLQVLEALAEDTGTSVNELLSVDAWVETSNETPKEAAKSAQCDFSHIPITAQSGKVLN